MKRNKIGLLLSTLIIFVIIGILVVPERVSALNQDVVITSSSATGSSMTVSGTTSAKAVAVQIRNSAGTICGMGTLGVKNGAFSGTIDNLRLPNGNYKIYVADYQGGTWAIDEVTVTGSSATSSSSGSSSSSVTTTSTCANGHDYQYTIVQEPTRTKDGYAAYVCTRCGAIDKNRPGADYRGYIRLPSYWQYQKESIAAIKAAPAGTLTINAEFWISFHKSVYDEIEKRPDLTVSVVFTWEDQDYIVTIPAGTKAEDIMDGLDYAGYVHVSSLFGCQPTVRER